jgi:hypothetical protein
LTTSSSSSMRWTGSTSGAGARPTASRLPGRRSFVVVVARL